MRRVGFHEAAVVDYQAAVDFYSSQSPGRGELFHEVVEAGLDRIERWPEAAPRWAEPLSVPVRHVRVLGYTRT